eukprot:TRINITY_DN7110_c0_g1_i2.p2 TRINITY_DN7110_c0_g1~~TRINITY_DN7110_c0_g1_i2.p2  ORF type:complete len:349 (+),score=99.20 TRINITY_DN7110_c0_g1_i2:96-1142(+)
MLSPSLSKFGTAGVCTLYSYAVYKNKFGGAAAPVQMPVEHPPLPAVRAADAPAGATNVKFVQVMILLFGGAAAVIYMKRAELLELWSGLFQNKGVAGKQRSVTSAPSRGGESFGARAVAWLRALRDGLVASVRNQGPLPPDQEHAVARMLQCSATAAALGLVVSPLLASSHGERCRRAAVAAGAGAAAFLWRHELTYKLRLERSIPGLWRQRLMLDGANSEWMTHEDFCQRTVSAISTVRARGASFASSARDAAAGRLAAGSGAKSRGVTLGAPAPGQPGGVLYECVVTDSGRTKLRRQADANCEEYSGSVEEGERCGVTAVYNGFCQVRNMDGHVGWIREGYVRKLD